MGAIAFSGFRLRVRFWNVGAEMRLQWCSQLLSIRDRRALVKLCRASLGVTAFSRGGQEHRGAWSSTRGRERALGRHGRPWLAVLGLPSSAAWLYAERLLLQEPERPVCDCLPPPDRGDARLGHSLACWLLWGKSNRLCVTVRRRRPRPCPVG